MGSDLFGFLTGVSPWWWIAGALALGAAEVATFTYFLLWPALGALSIGLVLFVAPEMSGSYQILGFALSTLAYGGIGWVMLRRMPDAEEPEPGLNRRAASLAGRHAVVLEAFHAGIGAVEVDGIRWRGRLENAADAAPAKGDVLQVAAVEGSTLILRP